MDLYVHLSLFFGFAFNFLYMVIKGHFLVGSTVSVHLCSKTSYLKCPFDLSTGKL